MKALRHAVKHLFAATKYTIWGIASTFRHELAFRQEVLLILPHFAALYLLGFPLAYWLFLSTLLATIMAAELLNTAIECVVDLVSPEFHALAKRAKDAASAAVGILLLVYFVSWIVLIVQQA